MSPETENLRTAWAYWLGQGDLGRLTQLADSLWLLYEANGWYAAVIDLGDELLGVLAHAPATPEHRQQEMALRAGLARATLASKGYGPESEAAYDAVLALVASEPDVRPDYPILRSLSTFYQFRGETGKALEVAGEIVRLAEEKNDPAMLVDGSVVMGSIVGFRNELQRGLGYLERGIALAEARGLRPARFRAGNDPAVACFTTSGFFLWLLGYPDRAVERMDRAAAEARRIGHMYSVAYALFHGGFLHVWRREPELTQERALAVINVAEEHDFPLWRALGAVLLGAAKTALGDASALAMIDENIDRYRAMSTPPVFWPMLLSLQARALGYAGRADEALAVVDAAMELAAGRAELTLAPEFLLLRGDMLAQTGSEESPETWFQQAFDLAGSLGQRLPQLRSATRIVALATEGQNDAELQSRTTQLAVLYQTFTEGFATADLREARDLLTLVRPTQRSSGVT
jgi:adenylate cyclase